MHRILDKRYDPSQSGDPQDLLLELDDLDQDEADGVAALAVHNEQLHRYLRED